MVGAAPAGPACLAGVLERGESFGIVYLRRDGGAVRIEVELRIDAQLEPGVERELEPVYLALGTDASGLLEAFADELGRRAQARTWQPFVSGWCSWYTAFHDVSEDDVRRNLEALSRARGELDLEVVQLDDGYQRAVGDWLETNERFPRGLAPLAAEIRAAGFVPGIWTAPFCVVEQSEHFAAHPGRVLHDDQEEPLRALVHPGWSEGGVYALDCTHPEVVPQLEALFRALTEMGFGYLKLDFLYAAALAGNACDARIARAARLRQGLEAIRRGAGEGAFLLGCGAPLGAAVGVVDAMRIGPDVAPRWDPDPATRIPGIESTQPAVRNALRNAMARAWMHRRLWLNDSDCLLARRQDTRLGVEERTTLATVVATGGGSVLVSDDLPALGAEERSLVRHSLAIARSVDSEGIPGRVRAPGLLEREFPDRLVAECVDHRLVALVNGSDESAACEWEPLSGANPGPTPEALLLPGGAQVGESSPCLLPPHASALLRQRRSFPLAVFCDFDGTFSVQDVGSSLAIRHGGERRISEWARYERGEITPWQYNMEILEGLDLPLAELEAFLREVDLDPGARALIAWCEANGVPFRVLSDGFDYNLNRLQVIHGVRFGYDANHLRYDRGRWRLAPGHPDPHCGCGTGTCKGGLIRAFREANREANPEALVVHIGNGRVSDTCGALAADAAFAKDSLAGELEKRGASFLPFATLLDVLPELERLRAEATQRGPWRPDAASRYGPTP